LITVLVLSGAAAVYLFPDLAAWCIYDRGAVRQGEVWRLLTSHLVHFDPAHLWYNLAAFGVAGWLVESQEGRGFRVLLGLMALGISGFLLAARPEMAWYGGLSGLACGCVAYLALTGAGEGQRWWWVRGVVFLLLVIKLVYEAWSGGTVLIYPAPLSFVPVWEAHVVGVMVALAAAITGSGGKRLFIPPFRGGACRRGGRRGGRRFSPRCDSLL
jgi:rhomboid family GlyGly-CTERM serine protease